MSADYRVSCIRAKQCLLKTQHRAVDLFEAMISLLSCDDLTIVTVNSALHRRSNGKTPFLPNVSPKDIYRLARESSKTARHLSGDTNSSQAILEDGSAAQKGALQQFAAHWSV
jgi:hypothetical protein